MSADKQSSSTAVEPQLYGLWASFGWYLAAEAAQRIFDFALMATGLQVVLDRNYLTHSLVILASWGIYLLIFVIAVRLKHLPLSEYFGWLRPRMSDVVLGIIVIFGLYAALTALLFFLGSYANAVNDYRAEIAAGTSPAWFVLRWWPTLLLSSTIEETVYRGFLWRGIQFRLGSGAAFVITTLVFTAAHYTYWLADGGVSWPTMVQYLFASSIYGALRWHSGGTIVPMIAHSLDNAGLKLSQIVVSALAP